jgi:hypothetical protein
LFAKGLQLERKHDSMLHLYVLAILIDSTRATGATRASWKLLLLLELKALHDQKFTMNCKMQ